MKITTAITRYKPTPPAGEVGIEEISMEDVASFEFTDNGITVHFNTTTDEFIQLRDNDGVGTGDWRGVTIFVTRKFITIA